MKRIITALIPGILLFLGCNEQYDVNGLLTVDYQVEAPTQLTAQALSNELIKLTWQDNCSFEDGYRIERSEDGRAWHQIADLKTNTTAFIDTGLNKIITYTYRVYAYHDRKNSDYSNTATAIPALMEVLDIEMVLVEGGTFNMGGSWDGWSIPLRPVTLDSFYISRYEITQAQLVDVLNQALEEGKIFDDGYDLRNTDGRREPLFEYWGYWDEIHYRNGQLTVTGGYENYAACYVSWYGAAFFCNWLSEREGFTPAYDLTDWSCAWNAAGYRLPTEAEWEFAARGGIHSQGYYFSGSNDPDEVAWYRNNLGHRKTWCQIVGLKKPNELGLFDMSGNLWEWCWDWKASPDYQPPAVNPHGPDSGQYRIYRGGSALSSTESILCYFPCYGPPIVTTGNIGFRIARKAP